MKKRGISFEFYYQLITLLVFITMVRGFYSTVVRPRASDFLAESQRLATTGGDISGRKSAWVILKDYEQEACFMLMFWAFAIIGYKAVQVIGERRMLANDVLAIPDGTRVLPEDTRDLARRIQGMGDMQQRMLVARVLTAALHRFGSSRSVQDTANAVDAVTNAEGERMESELSIIRYIAWAIPSVGFIGTVRGIGDALSQAQKAMSGDISGVTSSLGTAFNSTLIALFISLALMFAIHHLQRLQERFTRETGEYADEHLIRHLHTE